MTRWVSGLATLGAVAALMLAAGCGDDDGGSQPVKGTFVGKVEGSNAHIAVVSDGKRVGGYLCDSREIATWFDPSELSGGSGELRSRAGDRLGEATLSDDSATGEVSIGGRPHAFDAELATGDAGLYRAGEGGKWAVKGKLEAVWIVLPDGSQRGAAAPWVDVDIDPVVRPAPRLNPGAASINVANVSLRPKAWVDPITDP